MGLYTKKPVTIEAVLWDGRSLERPVPAWIGAALAKDPTDIGAIIRIDNTVHIATLEGTMIASPGDWIIRGVKGELYPCKPDIFAATYSAATGDALTFGDAVAALKAGHRVCRAGWNGKGMWLSLSGCIAPQAVPAGKFWSTNNAEYARQNGGSAVVLPSITMKTATGEILMGWLASQTDMLAEDWMILGPLGGEA